MKNLIFYMLFILVFFICVVFSQSKNALVNTDYIGSKSIACLEETDFQDKESILQLVKSMIDDPKKFNVNWKDVNLQNEAVVLLRKPFTLDSNKIRDLGETTFYILHKEGEEWSDYILDIHDILIVVLDPEKNIPNAEIEEKNMRSHFRQGLDHIISVFKRTERKELDVKDKEFYFRMIELNPNKIDPPSKILIKHESLKKDIEIIIHEKIDFQLQIGVAASSIKINDVKIANDSISVQKKSISNLKSGFNVTLNWIPFRRDIDRFNPDWRLWRVFTCRFWKDFHKRFSLFGGLRLSLNPLENYFAGISFAITREVYFDIGLVRINEVKDEQIVNIGDIKSVKDAFEFLDREYGKPKLFFGISFSPAMVSSAFK